MVSPATQMVKFNLRVSFVELLPVFVFQAGNPCACTGIPGDGHYYLTGTNANAALRFVVDMFLSPFSLQYLSCPRTLVLLS